MALDIWMMIPFTVRLLVKRFSVLEMVLRGNACLIVGMMLFECIRFISVLRLLCPLAVTTTISCRPMKGDSTVVWTRWFMLTIEFSLLSLISMMALFGRANECRWVTGERLL